MEESACPIVLFQGEMGSGKTTLIKAIAAELEVEDEVSSPTYSLVNEYQSPQGPVYHFDFYRLEKEGEALDIGLEEYLYSGYLCLIEWPEKIRTLMPPEHTLVEITVDGGQRIYKITQPTDE